MVAVRWGVCRIIITTTTTIIIITNSVITSTTVMASNATVKNTVVGPTQRSPCTSRWPRPWLCATGTACGAISCTTTYRPCPWTPTCWEPVRWPAWPLTIFGALRCPTPTVTSRTGRWPRSRSGACPSCSLEFFFFFNHYYFKIINNIIVGNNNYDEKQ